MVSELLTEITPVNQRHNAIQPVAYEKRAIRPDLLGAAESYGHVLGAGDEIGG